MDQKGNKGIQMDDVFGRMEEGDHEQVPDQGWKPGSRSMISLEAL